MAPPSGHIFSETLQEITNTKLEELSKSRENFERKRIEVTSALDSAADDHIKRLEILSDGIKRCFGLKTDKTLGEIISGSAKNRQLEIELKTLDTLLAQARYDPWASSASFKTWESSLFHHLDAQSLKYQYASLYAELVGEWLSSGKSKKVTETARKVEDEPSSTQDTPSGGKKAAARLQWEQNVFEPATVDENGLGNFLEDLFRDAENTKAKKDALKKLRDSVTSFEKQLSGGSQFNEGSLGWTIRGLLDSYLLSNEQREVLKGFQHNPIILSEIADVLNMKLAALENWSWGSAVAVEQQRRISGIYGVRMHEELLQAIFLQYIGVRWSVFFKKAFRRLRWYGGPWKNIRADVPKIDKRRLGYYLGEFFTDPSVQHMRRSQHRRDYFVANLLDESDQKVEMNDGEEEVELEDSDDEDMGFMLVDDEETPASPAIDAIRAPGAGRGGAMRHRKIMPEREVDDTETEEDNEGPARSKNPMKTKQKLLHILSTEIAINTRLHGEMTAVHTSFEQWNSLLPHATIKAVLEFFGVSPQWLKFFTAFLEAPLIFADQDDKSGPRIRRRGTPESHVLSTVFSEVVLFCLDFSVNQTTNGALLYRLHDDLWFWSPEHKRSVSAWKAIEQFATATGTTINTSKSGSVRISGNPDVTLSIDDQLPQGSIKWGFLRLSAETGLFEINQSMVDKHIDELRKQLQGKRDSIFSFVKTWNTYASTFFTSNFGKPAQCFSRRHVDLILSTHARIQREIFQTGSELTVAGTEVDGEQSTSVVGYLKNLIAQRFGIHDIPDAFLFFPVELGGLDLQSPFVSPIQTRDSLIDDSSTLLDKFEEDGRYKYNSAKKAFEKGEITPATRGHHIEEPDWEPAEKEDRESFFSFEEFSRWREEFSLDADYELWQVYKKLLEEPTPTGLDVGSEQIMSALSALKSQKNLRGVVTDWNKMEPYWRWVAMRYGPEVIERFGGLAMVDAGWLPMGMVSLFRDNRVKWQG